jgi:hypothetical protein
MRAMKRILMISLFIVLTVAACGRGSNEAQEATATPAPTETPVPPTDTPTPVPPTATPVPTDTPPPESAAPAMPGGTLAEKWRPPIGVSVLLFGTCNTLLGTAEKRQTEAIDDTEALSEVIAAAAILQALEERLAAWNPTPDQAALKQTFQNQVAAIQPLIDQWVKGEITAAEIPDLLGPTCEATNATLRDVLTEARNDGVSDEALQAIIAEIAGRLEGE